MDYLIHYGVKGMKWGVRRTPEQLGHKPSQWSAKDRMISPKNDLYRVSNTDQEFSGAGNKRGYTYVSTNKHDRDTYRAGWEYFKDYSKSLSDPMYEYTLNSVKPLTIAGGKTVVESLMAYHKDPHLDEFKKKKFATEGRMRRYLEKVAPDPTSAYEADKYTLTDFANKKNAKISSAVVKDLKAKGYDGMVDLFDRSWDAHDPTIVFDPDKKLKVKKVTSQSDWW